MSATGLLPSSFLRAPAVARVAGLPEVVFGTATDTPPQWQAGKGDPATRYELTRVLGVGGMGRVVEAFDHVLGRVVALKFLLHHDPVVLAAFAREARNQARIQHPHVLEVYDCGELDGEPFIAMRRVAGGTLAELRSTLSPELRIELLAQAAEGLDAAHRQGLLHRDVKPSNILVHVDPPHPPVALVSDFGLAAELGGLDARTSEGLAGSPHFIAPERLSSGEARVDRRADVYSLGITMYWVLVGELPLADQPTVEVLRRTVAGEVPPPRSRAADLSRDLEAIVLRATAREPSRRYSTAGAMAADLRRYLEGGVVEARADSWSYRAGRTLARNASLVATSALAIAAVTAATVVVVSLGSREQAARTRALEHEARNEELVGYLLGDLGNELEDLGRLDLVDDIGSAALGHVLEARPEESADVDMQQRAALLFHLGDVRARRGELQRALGPMAESLRLVRRLATEQPGSSQRLFDRAQSEFGMGFIAWEQGRLEVARRHFETYFDLAQELVAREPADPQWQRELAYAHSNLGTVLRGQGDVRGALAHFQAALAIELRLVAAKPGAETLVELSASHEAVAVALQDLGRLREASKQLESSLSLRRELAQGSGATARSLDFLGAGHGQMGIQHLMLGQQGLAEQHFGAMLAIFEALHVRDPTNGGWALRLAWAHLERGRLLFERGDRGGAADHWQRQEELTEALLARDPTVPKWRRTQAVGMYQRARLLHPTDVQASRRLLAAAVGILSELRVQQPDDRSLGRWLSHCHLLLGSSAPTPHEARAAYAQAIGAVSPFLGDGLDGRMLAPLAAALRCSGRHEQAAEVEQHIEETGYHDPELEGVCPGGGMVAARGGRVPSELVLAHHVGSSVRPPMQRPGRKP